uniref:PB1 domain-containing protein n=1 Tax=Leersia perrieri TaxID=77586 RepID=A0A0D9VMH6_9ORYZ
MADSGDSSPHSAAATDDAHHDGTDAAAEKQAPAPPQPPAKVRLMVSYGGRIQPRPHDHQLSYVNGDTKILSLERPLRFADFAVKLAALAGPGCHGDFCVKYQLPGEDLDALVSVTNDEDLEHLVLEYDRLHLLRPSPGSGASAAAGGGGSSRGGSTPRLRVFLFPVQSPPPPPQPSGLLEPKQEQRGWFVDALNSVHPPPPPSPPQLKQEQSPPPAAAPMPMPMLQPPVLQAQTEPDYLFGLDNGFVPPPAVKVKDPAGDPPTLKDNVPVEIPTKNDDRLTTTTTNPVSDHIVVSPVVSPGEYQRRQIQNLEKLQVADAAAAQQQQPPPPTPATAAPPPPPPTTTTTLPRNGSDDSLTRAYPPATITPTPTPEYYLPKYQEKPTAPPQSSAPATAFLPVPGRYTSVAPGSGADHGPVFFIPAPPHGYFTTAAAAPGAASFPTMYAVAPHNGNANANGNGPSAAASNAQAYAAPQVAYDSNGRAIYYTSMLPQYASAVNGVPAPATVLGADQAKPVAVKPTVS